MGRRSPVDRSLGPALLELAGAHSLVRLEDTTEPSVEPDEFSPSHLHQEATPRNLPTGGCTDEPSTSPY